jgi:hypothetical protein
MTGNVQKGLYRNPLGVELHVTRTATSMSGYNTLAGDIAIAEARDDLFGMTVYLVTEASLRDCGYELIEASS